MSLASAAAGKDPEQSKRWSLVASKILIHRTAGLATRGRKDSSMISAEGRLAACVVCRD
jgi:hypothetical protein